MLLIDKTVIIVESVHLVGRLNSLMREIGCHSPFAIATFGRVKDVDPSIKIGVDDFESSRSVLHHDVVSKISSIENSIIFVATDSDIEGELIARDVTQYIDHTSNDVHRISIKALTAESLSECLSNTRPIDEALVQTCLSRRSVDKQIDQFSPGSGRVLSHAMGRITSRMRPSEREQMLSEISLTGVNTVSLLAHGIIHGARPPEVSHSLQKLYSQGRITYPRTLDGISPSRNVLAPLEPHGAVEPASDFAKYHYDTMLDDLLLRSVHDRQVILKSGQAGTRPLDSLLTLYKMPYMRASTISHHADRLSRFMGKDSLSLTSFGWRAYREASTELPSLCSTKGSLELHEILHDDRMPHKERVTMALEHLGIEGGGKGRGKPIFIYPDDPSDISPSPQGPA